MAPKTHLELIKERIQNNYEHQTVLMFRDILFLVKTLDRAMEKSESYWNAANAAELRVQELEERLEVK